MQAWGGHEDIRLKITAFLFNRRADALRTEMYEALCLHVLSEIGDDPCDQDWVVDMVKYALNLRVEDTSVVTLLVSETLRDLVRDGVVVCQNGLYSLREGEALSLPDDTGQAQLRETISNEIESIAHSLSPTLSRRQIDLLQDFFVEVADVVVQHQLRFVAMGYGLPDVEPDTVDASSVVAACVKKYGIREFIDVDEFVRKTLLRPSETLSNYLYTMIQVGVITQLLAWDPSLQYLRATVLSGKTLYLDSNLLFILMEGTNPLHLLLRNLLRASYEDLGVRVVVLESTVYEYEQTLDWADRFFAENHSYYRQVASLCLREGRDPGESFDLQNALFEDYLKKNPEHIDLGSWRDYLNSIKPAALRSLLESLSVEISSQSLPFIPEGEYERVKEAMLKASQTHVDLRSGRRRLKRDVGHDVRMYYLIQSIRTKGRSGESSLGYDTYLLTLDGSLVHFTKEMKIHYTDTYFMYPNQWYELAFPFLRLSVADGTGVASGLASLVFSSAFPALASLIPLELSSYVFDLGGTDLSVSSVRNVVEALLEKRLVESLDPTNVDERQREKEKLEIKRMIAEEERKSSQRLHKIEDETRSLSDEKMTLEEDIAELTKRKNKVASELDEVEADLEQYGGTHATAESIRRVFEQSAKEMEVKHAAVLERQDRAAEEAQEEKDREIAEQRAKIKSLEGQVDDLRSLEYRISDLEGEQRRREQEKRRRKDISILDPPPIWWTGD